MSFFVPDHIPGIYRIHRPKAEIIPLVVDSPHSGTCYPVDFGHAVDMTTLRHVEDMYVAELMAGAPSVGVPLLEALFPRSYIDPNRAEDDIDTELLDAPWPGSPKPTEKSRLGVGLIRRLITPGKPLYDRRLPPVEIEARISRFWRPYHAALKALLGTTHAAHGSVWHIDAHSYPTCCGFAGSLPNIDFVLGDRDGTSCTPAFLRRTRACLEGLGYCVAVNDPYRGVEILRLHGDPKSNRYSLQLEIRRSLYMNEDTLEKTDGFAPLQANLRVLLSDLADYVRAQTCT
ncbi:MAG: N-formylglutamate amidohydrolase [Pseudomonadota bacterium]|nr:N-formylglutamate amidohydrolase [Pseudomonadota bacterium]